ncbi:hypothetical protein ACFQ0T_17425 [Kitasatospora gansuensis]
MRRMASDGGMWKKSRVPRLLTACGLLSASLLAGTVAGTPNALAAITFTKTVDKANPAPGENVTYTLSYTCSQTDCENGKITDALPAGMEFVGWTPDATTVDVDNSTVPAAGAKGARWTSRSTRSPPAPPPPSR